MENKNNINIKTGEKHFDISKNRAVDLRAKNMEKEKQYSSDEENKINEKSVEKKPVREGVFKSFLKKHKTASGLHSPAGTMEPTADNTPLAPLKRGIFAMEPSLSSKIFDKAIATLLYFLVFALPLFILPFSMEIYEFNKTLLLFFISSLAFLIWIAKMILIDKRLTFVRTPLNVPIIAFISLVLVSTAFSVDKISSILGFYGRFSDSLLVYLSLAMLYFVVVNVMTKDSESSEDSESGESVETGHCLVSTTNLIKAFLASAFIVAIVGLLYFFGLKFIPWQETQFRSFNLTSGSLNVFGMYLVAVILIALHYCDRRRHSRMSPSENDGTSISKHLMLVLVAISLVLLAIIDFIIAWIVLAVSLIVALFLTFISGRTNNTVIARSSAERRGNPDVNGDNRNDMDSDDSGGIASVAPLPRNDRSNSFVVSILIILISSAFVATSLTFINKDAESNFFSSIISTSIKNRIVVIDNDQVVRNDGFNREVILDKNTAISVVTEGIKQDPIAGIIGSGPGTYLYNFSKFKPAEFNNNPFWNIRFDKAGSEILEKVSTVGILGTLSYLLIIILAMGMFLKMLWRVRRDEALPRLYGTTEYLFAAWFALLLFQFLYLEATTTKFIFWLLTAILVAEYCAATTPRPSFAKEGSANSLSPRERVGVRGVVGDFFTLNLKKEKSSFYSSLLVLIILFLSFSSAYYYQFKFYQAEAGYKKVVLRQNEALVKSDLSAEQIWEVLNKNTDELKEVIAKNPHRGTYKAYLSDIYLNRMNVIFQEESQKDESERNNQRIAEEAKNTIDYAKNASDSNPNNIIFQHKIADVYMIASRDIGIVGADEWAVKKYRKAIDLEPTNPVLYTSFGKIYALYYSVTKSAENINQAISEFEKALELKSDYLEAGLQLGIAYENAGDNQKAINILNSFGSLDRIENLIAANRLATFSNSRNLDVDIAFQLGRIYYNTEKISEAKNIFTKITKVNPGNSNAHYSLGLIYEKEENYEMALAEFKAVLSANPENEDVKSKIEELEKIVNKNSEPIIEPIIEPVAEDGTEESEIEEEEVEEEEVEN